MIKNFLSRTHLATALARAKLERKSTLTLQFKQPSKVHETHANSNTRRTSPKHFSPMILHGFWGRAQLPPQRYNMNKMKYDQFTCVALNTLFHTFLLVSRKWSHSTSNQTSKVGLLQRLLSVGLWSIGTFSVCFFYVYDVGERCPVKTTHLWLAEVMCGSDSIKAKRMLRHTQKNWLMSLCLQQVGKGRYSVISATKWSGAWTFFFFAGSRKCKTLQFPLIAIEAKTYFCIHGNSLTFELYSMYTTTESWIIRKEKKSMRTN